MTPKITHFQARRRLRAGLGMKLGGKWLVERKESIKLQDKNRLVSIMENLDFF